MVKIIINLQFLLLFLSSNSFSAEKIVIKAERLLERTKISNSIIYDSTTLVTGTNSNSICGAQKTAYLGLFKRSINNFDKSSKNLLLQIQNRLKEKNIPKTYDKLGTTAYYLGKHNVSNNHTISRTVKRLLATNCDLSKWKLTRAVKVEIIRQKKQPFLKIETFIKNKKISSATHPLQEEVCSDIGKMPNGSSIIDCSIENFGIARLILGNELKR